jgi:hypothetical protein
MIRYLRARTVRKPLVMALAFSMSGLIGDLHAYAADATVKHEDSAAPGAEGRRAQSDAVKAKGLITVEQVYAGMLQAEQARASAARVDPSVDNAAVAEKWGVQVLSVSYAADGFWLEFRFRVVDPAKASVLFDTKIKPYLESEASGVKLAVPTAAKVGALRTTNRGHNIQAGKIYNIMFSNPGFHVQLGQKVTVAAGDFKVEHLTVRGARANLRIDKTALHNKSSVK